MPDQHDCDATRKVSEKMPANDDEVRHLAKMMLQQEAERQASQMEAKPVKEYYLEVREALGMMMAHAAKYVGIRPKPWEPFDEGEIEMWCAAYHMTVDEARVMNQIPYRLMNIAVHGIRNVMKRAVLPVDRLLLVVDGRPWASCKYQDIMNTPIEPWPTPLDAKVSFAVDEPSLLQTCDVLINLPGEVIQKDHLIEKSAVFMAIEQIRKKHEAAHLKEEADKIAGVEGTGEIHE